MTSTMRSLFSRGGISSALALGFLVVLPGAAWAHGDHGEGWVDCEDTATADVEEGSGADESVSSDGDVATEPMCHAVPGGVYDGGTGGYGGVDAEGGTRGAPSGRPAAACPEGSRGSTGGSGALAPDVDSSAADIGVDSGTADGGDFVAHGVAAGAWGRTSVTRAAVCAPIATVAGLIAPNRIDAGAGGTAASTGPAVAASLAAGAAAGMVALRRRRR